MKQFKALILKEYNTHKKQFLVAIWINLGVYAAIIIGLIIDFVRNGKLNVISLNSSDFGQFSPDLIMWGVNFFLAIVPAVLIFFVAGVVTENILNEDFKKKCAIFHLSQPVNLWKIIGSKVAAITGIFSIVLLLLTLLNGIVVSTIMSFLFKSNFGYGMIAMVQSYLLNITNIIFFTSISWIFSSMFTEKSGIKSVGLIIGYETTRGILLNISGIKLPSFVMYTTKLAFNNLHTVGVNFQTTKKFYTILPQNDQLRLIIQETWLSILNGEMVLKLVISVGLFALSYYFYKKREIL